ncbi:MAG: VTT domain-containing protein [Actinomycetota bacterium]|nr:VTT domain-containing protein [Actinomycetota bacterium]
MDEQAAAEAALVAGSVAETEAKGLRAGQKQDPWDDPRIPWAGKPGRADILCWAGIVLSGIFYWAMLPFRASLVGTHPVLLELLNGTTESIISAAAFARIGHGTLVVVLLAAVPGLMKFDPLYWWAGRLWGERVIILLSGRRNRGAKYMARVQRWGRKFTWPAVVISPFLPIPNAIIYVIAGWAGMRLVTFIILDVIGSLLWAGTLAGLGYALGHHAVVVAQAISRYGLWFSIGLVVVIMFFQFRSQRHMMKVMADGRTARAQGQAAADALASDSGTADSGTADSEIANTEIAGAGAAGAQAADTHVPDPQAPGAR